jgi:glycosyltransferase involved in cell wall biosynthesis
VARTVFGVPLYNHARLLPEALDSLLAQTGDFGLVVVDDASTDATPDIARGYAERHELVRYERNPARLGLIGAWRRALELARQHHPGAEYFAWGSDHDVWDPRWLESMLPELAAHPEAVLAYPIADRIGERGERLRARTAAWRFDTAGVTDGRERFRRFCRDGVAGDMVYGLFRLAPLGRVGFPAALHPDRLLLARLSLAGEFRQVPEVLWRRRYEYPVSPRRQRASLFAGAPPRSTRVPWPLSHFAALLRELPAAGIGRAQALALAAGYLRSGALRRARKHLLRPVAAASRRRSG